MADGDMGAGDLDVQ
jgi:hypothetical protein